MPDSTPVLEVKVNLTAMRATLESRVSRVIEYAAFGLQAAEALPDETELLLPQQAIHVGVPKSGPTSAAAVRDSFKTWLLGEALGEAISGLNAFLERVRDVCSLWSLGEGEHTGDDWNQLMVHEARNFHRLGLPDKFGHLRERYGEGIVPDTRGEVLSINQARNCLEHRGGIVSSRDVNTDAEDALLVRWRRIQLYAHEDGADTPVALPAVLMPGQSLRMSPAAPSEKQFNVGEQVVFSEQEFGEICWTLILFGLGLTEQVQELGRRLGVLVDVSSDSAN